MTTKKSRSKKAPARKRKVAARKRVAKAKTIAQPVVVLQAADVPAIGKPWVGQRGLRMAEFAGTNDGPGYHLIVVTDANDKPIVLENVEYGGYGTKIPDADSYTDGLANTEAMLKAGLPLAKKIRSYGDDCYLASIFEEQAVCANNRGQLPKVWCISSTQGGAYGARCQSGEGGYSLWSGKNDRNSAFVVRRVPIQAQ